MDQDLYNRQRLLAAGTYFTHMNDRGALIAQDERGFWRESDGVLSAPPTTPAFTWTPEEIAAAGLHSRW